MSSYNQPYVKKFEDLQTGSPVWKVLQEVKDKKDGTLSQKELKIFSDRFTGESDAFKWIRNNTNVWSPNR